MHYLRRLHKSKILGFLALALALAIACGPTAESGSGPASNLSNSNTLKVDPPTEPIAQANPQSDPQNDPQATPTPDVPTTKILPLPPTPRPTKPPLGPPYSEPTRTPKAEHPEGYEGCKNHKLFSSPENDKYLSWCFKQIKEEIKAECRNLGSTEDQLACGTRMADEFQSVFIKDGIHKCQAISHRSDRLACMTQTASEHDAHFVSIFDGWNKVHSAVNNYPDVQAAMQDIITCLEEDHDHENVDHKLLFHWQRLEAPDHKDEREKTMPETDKTIRDALKEPSKACAEKHGLYHTQDTAWIEELERLQQTEPDTVRILIHEGLLEALKAPGPEIFLTGERPS